MVFIVRNHGIYDRNDDDDDDGGGNVATISSVTLVEYGSYERCEFRGNGPVVAFMDDGVSSSIDGGCDTNTNDDDDTVLAVVAAVVR